MLNEMNRTPFSGIYRAATRLFPALLLCVIALSACSDSILDLYVNESNTTSGSVGPFVDTSNLQLSVMSFYAYPGVDGIMIDLNRADTLESLRIGIGDILRVSLNGTLQPIEEVKNVYCARPTGPCRYWYYYRVYFADDPQNLDLTIDLQRLAGVNSLTTVTFPPRATITQPVASDIFELSADDLVVSWQAGGAGDETSLAVNGDCGVYKKYYFDNATTTYTFPAGTFHFAEERAFCASATALPLPLQTSRTRIYPADPALSAASSVALMLVDEVTATMVP